MLGATLEKLSTGFKINRASDGPAALVISERLKGQLVSLQQAVETSDRARQMVNTAEAALTEVSNLLISIQDLIIEAANDGALSNEEILANQFQVDSAIETITRIASVTSYGELSLLNGNLDYTVSGLSYSTISDFGIHGAQITNGVSQIRVQIAITSNAEKAGVSQPATTVNALNNSGLSLLITGNLGAELIKLSPNTSVSAIRDAVNGFSDSTGVVAAVSNASLIFQSQGFGSDQFVHVQDLTATNVGNELFKHFDEGVDVVGSINGHQAAARGLEMTTNTFQLHAEFLLSANFWSTNGGTVTGTASASFYVTGGGATFQLGENANVRDQEFLGIQRITSDNLGDGSVGYLKDLMTGGSAQLLTNPELAHQIVAKAIDDITLLRARLGAFVANTLDSNTNSLDIAIRSLQSSVSNLLDTDFAEATAEFTKNQILVQAGTSVLAQANVAQQSVLQLFA
jgi:flagellin